ncbi:hypothetical protein F5Y13DRAFT_161824 [Hypoxylon sp. FL1857]|nr:hypothetical protein F5Y13DRAFT_161824 [Hypoxylon sp. FL1857]
MAPSKEDEAKGDVLPAYEELPGPSSASAGQEEASSHGPSIASPFNFPSDTHLPPAYQASEIVDERRPIAIPQISPDPKSPFLNAYSQSLLGHGVTPDTWTGFLQTLSGFLAATVSEKAVSHAAEIGRHIGDVPRRFGKETLAHVKETGHSISDSAKKGNYIGAAVRTILGVGVALPVATAFRAVGAVVSLPFAAINAVTKDPKTPKERAVAYAAAANVKWLHKRGLQAALLDTTELSQVLGVSADEFLQTARASKDGGAAAQLAALGSHIAELDVRTPGPLELGPGTFWLVVTQKGEDEEHDYIRGKGKETGGRRPFAPGRAL